MTKIKGDGPRVRYDCSSPAYQYRDENGTLRGEEWKVDDKLHRLDGPAFQRWHPNGQLWYEEWYIKGERVEPISDPLEWALWIAQNFGNVPGIEQLCQKNIEEKTARAILASSRIV